MIYLITGEDRFRVNKMVDKIKNENGSDSINEIILDGNATLGEIREAVFTLPFLADKKIITISNLFKNKDKKVLEDFGTITNEIPDFSTVILIEDETPSSNLKLYKSIQKFGRVEIFNTLNQKELVNFILDLSQQMGYKIQPKSAEILAQRVGGDLIRLENELKKLGNYNPMISDETIDKLVRSDFSDSIFSLMDAISEKNIKKSMKLLESFLDNGENETYIFSMISRQIRNLLIVSDLKITNSEAEIAKITSLHPFVVKKTLAQSKNFTKEKLLLMHSLLVEADLELKTSSLSPKIILSRLISKFVS